MKTKITIFYSYADKDKKWREAIETHLSRDRANITIEHRYHDQIAAGARLEDVKSYIEQANIILLLLSSDFLAHSGHYDSVEVQHILQLYADKMAAGPSAASQKPHIIPVLVRPCNWDGTPFAGLQSIPRNKPALTRSIDRDTALAEVAYEIEKTFNLPPDDTPPDLPKTPRQAESKMPLSNPFFTGREDLLNELREKLTSQKTTALTHKQAIYGLGGIGKTQLAVKYVERYRTDYQYVFWVNAASRTILIEEYVEIAHNLLLSERREKEQDRVVEAVKRWLEMSSDWLLVLDNADNLEMVQDFIPLQINGHLLLTTRAQALGEIAEPLDIGRMSLEEGALFLLRRAKRVTTDGRLEDATPEDRWHAERIVQELGSLPLALDQAGAYIEETREGLRGYLELYRDQGIKLLQESGLRRSHSTAVAKTFSLTFTQLKRSKPIAVDVLRLCAFLAPDAIPERLLTAYLSTLTIAADFSPQTQKVFKNPFARGRQATQPLTRVDVGVTLNEASRELLRYSLIHRDDRTETFAVHRLVQAVLRESMDEDTQRQWAEHAVRALGSIFPLVEIDKLNVTAWPECQELLPHVSVCAYYIKQYQFSFPEAARLLNDAATYLTERGQYKAAEPLYALALDIRKAKGGLPYAQSLYNLARVYYPLASYDRAERNLLKALEIQENVLGENHRDLAPTLESLAILYNDFYGRTKKAEQFYERASRIRQTSSGPEFYLSQNFSNQIAYYRREKNYTKIEVLYKEALDKIKQMWGEEDPRTARILYDWGESYKAQKKLNEAEAYLQRALDIRKKVLTLNNPDTASSIHSIAELYNLQGKVEEAEQLYKQALSIREEVLGAENPETAATLYSLAKLYKEQYKIVEAEQLYNQALAIRKKTFGPNHPATLLSQHELADFYKSQGRLAEAEPLYKRGLTSGYLKLRPDDPVIIQNLRDLVDLYTRLDQHEKIEQLYEEALTQRASRLGINHPSTEQCVQDLLKLYTEHDEHEKKVLLYQRTFALRARKLKGNVPASLQNFKQNLKDLACLYDTLKRPRDKMSLYMKAQEICVRTLGVGDRLARYCYDEWMKLSEDPQLSKEVEKHAKGQLVAKTLALTAELSDTITDYQETKQGLVGMLKKQRQFEEAEQTLKQGLADCYQKLGFDHPASAESRHEIVQFYEEHNKLQEAEFVYLVAIELCKTKLNAESPYLIECLNDLVSFYLRHKKYDAAKPLMEKMQRFIAPLLEEQPVPEQYKLAIIRTRANAALLKQRLYKRQWKTALCWFEQALQVSEEHFGKQHPMTADIRQRYISFLREIGYDAKAAALEMDAITMEEADGKTAEEGEEDEEDESF